jgi:hypothetical protein
MSKDFDNINANGVTVEGTYTPDKLFDRDTVTRKRTIAAAPASCPAAPCSARSPRAASI